MLKVAIIRFLLFWGVWLLVPMAIDGITAVGYLWVAVRNPKAKTEADQRYGQADKVLVTILVPIYNAEKTLHRCLSSLASQGYPKNLMEVICVGNAVTDRSRGEFARATRDFPKLHATWMELPGKGKSRALNAGIMLSKGELILNVDADARLSPDAVSKMVQAFSADLRLCAASGSVQVDEVRRESPWWWRLLNQCEITEYLQAFRVGRRFQTYRNTMFTLSGAFAAFRREVLVATRLYDDSTVSEDTKLTFDIRGIRSGYWHIGYVEDAQAFVEPIRSMSRFMSQRLRWQRGELEVLSLYPQYYRKSPVSALGSFVGRILISDHTLAFPRLVWVFIIPFLFVLGYSLPLVAAAMWVTYSLYVILEGAFVLSVSWPMREAYGHGVAQWWYLPILMPLYRFTTYWFRLAGMIYALTESAQWSTKGEMTRVLETVRSLKRGFRSSGPDRGQDRPA